MKLGIHVARFDWAGSPQSVPDVLAATGRAADASGISSLSLMDHYFQLEILGRVTDPMLEGYTTLAFLSAHSSRSEPRGTSGSTVASASRSLRSPNGSIG